MRKPIKLPEKILFVDDEPQILDSFRRQLRGKFTLDTANGGPQALEMVKANNYAVVVSDLKMPNMDGITLLSAIKEASPDTVRMMLTGFADVNNAIEAVNQGAVFRFLTKPADKETLVKALVAAIRQYRLQIAERQLLEQTLRGSIKVLTDILALVNPVAFGRASRIARYVKKIAAEMGLEGQWQYEAAAMLSQVGCLTLPEGLVRKVVQGIPLDKKERQLYEQHPAIAAELISGIPRLEEVSRIVAYQEKLYNGQGPPEGGVSGAEIPLGARMLKAVLDFDALTNSGLSKGRAIQRMKSEEGFYDPTILQAFEAVLGEEARYDIRQVGVYDLEENMILDEDLTMGKGARKLLAKGQQLSSTMITSIRNYNRAVGIDEPIKVRVPIA